MKRILTFCLFFTSFYSFSQIKETFQTKQIAESKKFVCFFFIKTDKNILIPYGTGFFVSKRVDSINSRLFLVTAKHVLKDSTGKYLNEIFLRYNLQDGKSEVSKFNLITDGNNPNVIFHPDASVDLAVVKVSGDFSRIDFGHLSSENMMIKDEFLKNGIAEGTEVFFTGLFTSYYGERKNYPIHRFGRIALIPEEKIAFVDAKRDLILLETTSYGGNSGSPVFVSYTSGRYEIRKLIGIMTGSFEEFNELGFLTYSTEFSKENSGISAITPSNYLIEILESL